MAGYINIKHPHNSHMNINKINYKTPSSLVVDGSLVVKGQDFDDVVQRLVNVEKRLAILTPDPKKLAQFETLQKLYNQYQMTEALCESREDIS
jgi:hypothetical protein